MQSQDILRVSNILRSIVYQRTKSLGLYSINNGYLCIVGLQIIFIWLSCILYIKIISLLQCILCRRTKQLLHFRNPSCYTFIHTHTHTYKQHYSSSFILTECEVKQGEMKWQVYPGSCIEQWQNGTTIFLLLTPNLIFFPQTCSSFKEKWRSYFKEHFSQNLRIPLCL